jgi:hypothetical protein
MFYVGILVFGIVSFISAWHVNRKGDKTIKSIQFEYLTDPTYKKYF